MRPLAKAAIEAGLIDEETLGAFKRWGFVPRDIQPGDCTPEEAIESIQDALEDEGQVRLQATDLDVLRFYQDEDNQLKGQLVLIDRNTEGRTTKTVTFAIRSVQGRAQYIIPYITEAVADLLSNGDSYLRWNAAGKSHRIYVVEAEPLYFGETCMFLLCQAMEAEDNG